MTVHGDLERAIAMAQAARGNYLLFAAQSEDEKAHQVFKQMAEDMERHVMILESRLQYLEQYNTLVQHSRGQQQGQDQGSGQGQRKAQGQGQTHGQGPGLHQAQGANQPPGQGSGQGQGQGADQREGPQGMGWQFPRMDGQGGGQQAQGQRQDGQQQAQQDVPQQQVGGHGGAPHGQGGPWQGGTGQSGTGQGRWVQQAQGGGENPAGDGQAGGCAAAAARSRPCSRTPGSGRGSRRAASSQSPRASPCHSARPWP